MLRWWVSTLCLLMAVAAQAFPTFPATHTLGIDWEASGDDTFAYKRYEGIKLGNYQKGVAIFDISEARRLVAQGARIYLNFYLSRDWDLFDFPMSIFVFPGHNASHDDFAWNATQAPPDGTTDFFGPYGWEILSIDGREHQQKFEARAEGCTFEFRDKYPYSACHFEPYSVDVTSWIPDPRLTTGEFGALEPYMGVLFHMLPTDDGIVTVTSLAFSDNLDDYGLLKAGLNLDTKPLQRMVLPSDDLSCNRKEATVVGTFNDDNIVLAGVEGQVVVTFDGADRITGGDGADTICPGNGNNLVYGGGGDDWIQGGGLSESLFGGPGNDTIRGGGGSNLIVGAGGDDTLIGEADSQNVLRGDGGNDVLQAGASSVCDGGNDQDQASRDCGVHIGIEAVIDR